MFNRCKNCQKRSVKRVGDVCAVCAGTAPAEAVQAAAAPPPPEPGHRLGDKVAAVAKALGFQQTPGCGCAQRQAALNEARSVGDVARALLRPNG